MLVERLVNVKLGFSSKKFTFGNPVYGAGIYKKLSIFTYMCPAAATAAAVMKV